jgi:hypothetical protein
VGVAARRQVGYAPKSKALVVHSSLYDDAHVKATGLNHGSAESTSSKPSSDVTCGASTRFARVNVMATFEIYNLLLLE